MDIKRQDRKREYGLLLLLLIVAFGLRIILAYKNEGFFSDISCFYNWSLRAYDVGLTGFYAEGFFADYPPGYIYISYLVGALLRYFNCEFLSTTCLIVLKFPAILCDMMTGFLVYRIAKGENHWKRGLLFSALFLLNPAIMQNSSIWGQVDSVYTLAVFIMCLLLYQKKMVPAYFVYAVGVLIKPQTLIFTPLLLWGIYENVFAEGFQGKKFLKNLLGGLSAIGFMALACLPFGIEKIFNLYFDTMGSYPYVSVNAYNFWAMFGLDWVSQEELFLQGISYQSMGTMVIFIICVCTILIFVTRRNCKDRYCMASAFLITSMFLFSVRMHERYIYPAMLFLLMIYLVNGDKHFLTCYLWFSLFIYLNSWHVMKYFLTDYFYPNNNLVIGISMGMVLGGIYFYRSIILCEEDENLFGESHFKERHLGKTLSEDSSVVERKIEDSRKEEKRSFGRKDILYMFLVTAFYAVFAFYHLGDKKVPDSEYHAEVNDNILLKMPEGQGIAKIGCYLNYEKDAPVYLYEWDYQRAEWNFVQEITFHDVYKWNMVSLDVTVHTRDICLVTDSQERNFAELVFCDYEGNMIVPENADEYKELFDEGDLFPGEVTHMSGTYFDEIYYSRVVHEFEEGLPTYEWTHPPLGKILISIGALLFGKTPFGFRFMGALFGCLMLPFMYLFGRNICKSREIGFFAAFLFAFDFMHFTQTRIATIDVYITFFVILMYYFMEKYIHMERYTGCDLNQAEYRKAFIPLFGAGLAFGLGIASKWTGFYAGAGLAILFFGTWALTYQKKKDIFQLEKEKGKEFQKRFWKTCAGCILFFIIIPVCIYTLSYIPFRNQQTDMGLIARMIQNQKDIFGYHTNVTDTHPFESTWNQWPTMIRPIMYFSSYSGRGMARGISAFGNPFVWWAGIPAFIYMVYLIIRKKDGIAAFLCIGYLAQYLPWMLVDRCTFIYHYFPSVPFVVLMITYGLYQFTKHSKTSSKWIVFGGYAILTFAAFLIYYPVLSGEPVDREYAQQTLRLLKDWVLVN